MKKYLRKIISNTGFKPCEICEQPELLVEHHINGRKISDFDADWNKCYICPNCHNKVHRNLITVEGRFQTTDGYKLLHHGTTSSECPNPPYSTSRLPLIS